jgi:hypothetical protein
MPSRLLRSSVPIFLSVLLVASGSSIVNAQSANERIPQTSADHESDHSKARDAWFYRGRVIAGQPSAELRRRAYQTKMRMRAERAAALAEVRADAAPSSSLPWTALGPAPLASDATGNGTQDYHQVAGRATAVAIDPADPTGNTVYVGGAQAGAWKSTNAAATTANSVTWTPLTDDQATLSIGAIAIQPANSNPANSVILAATGEANNSSDSYFGLGILRSTNGGKSWTLISTANGGALSFSGLGGTRMAFSTATGKTSTVVAAMGTSSEGIVDGAVTTGTTRGLYTSQDAGQTWTYGALSDPGGATDATSATSVVYNSAAGLFFAAIRYHGFYSSPDGMNWTRVAVQPGGSVLSTTACPPQSTSNSYACPIYRGEISVVPGRNEMYAWFISLAAGGGAVDGGIWQSVNGGASWASISDAGITDCGDVEGCGVEQGAYDLELAAVPDGQWTDLYAGAVNLYKCSITSQNPTCTTMPFLNLTHAYGCDPIAAPAHMHPDQHALAFALPASGTDSGNDLMYFANDGGVYRALDGFTGLTTGSCSATNAFDDLNQNLGSMTQFVSFSQHPSDPSTLLGGAEGNGSPATNQATTNSAWGNVLGGDGGYNAIDPNAASNFYASNPDVPPGGLGVQLCPDGVNCVDSAFSFVVTSDTVGGDDGAFYFPYILDPQSTSAMLVGTCRVWRGPRTGGGFTVLSPNFDTLGSGTCAGSEVNLVGALAAGGPTDTTNGSTVIYATTSGLGPIEGPESAPAGGNVWVTTNATAGASSFANVTNNGPAGSINPNQFPISSVAMDASDARGATAYVTVMGFTGGPGHVWKTTNAGATWSDFTGNLPDSPTNAVVVDSANAEIYVGTDVGVFASSTAAASWTEVGPTPGQAGFLPNVAVTALGIFNSGGEELLRASTYGRGLWQFPIMATADYSLAISNWPLTIFAGQSGSFSGTATATNGYASTVTLSCVAGATAPPTTCSVSPASLTPATNTPFSVSVSGAAGDYNFDVQGVGSDPRQTTHAVPVTLHVVSFGLTTPSPATVTVAAGETSSPVSFQVTAAGSFEQAVTVSCTTTIANATCALTPGSSVNPTSSSPVNMTATVSVPAGTAANRYPVTIQATTAGAPAALTTSFTLSVTSNPDFGLTEPSAFPEVNAGSTGTSGAISITAKNGFSGTVSLSCTSTASVSCSITPSSVSSFPATATLVINGTGLSAGTYSVSVAGVSGSLTHSISVPFSVGDYMISGTESLSLAPSGQGTANLTLTSQNSYTGKINATCDATALAGAICELSPANPLSLESGGTASLTATINVPNSAANGKYNININTQDTTGAPSHSFVVAVTVGQDFTLTSSTASQTVNPGQTTGPYNLTIQPVGGSFSGAVTLSCSGLPALSQCSFAPATPITPGNSPAAVVLTIATTAATSSAMAASLGIGGFGLCVWFALVGIAQRRKNFHQRPRHDAGRWIVIATMLLLMALPSCSGVSSGTTGGGHPGTPPGTYKITVTGTSSAAPPDAGQSTQVTLVVN